MAKQVKFYDKSAQPGPDDIRIETVPRFYPVDHAKRITGLFYWVGLIGLTVVAVYWVASFVVESVGAL